MLLFISPPSLGKSISLVVGKDNWQKIKKLVWDSKIRKIYGSWNGLYLFISQDYYVFSLGCYSSCLSTNQWDKIMEWLNEKIVYKNSYIYILLWELLSQ